MTTNIIVNHIGSYDGANGHFQYFDNAAKKKDRCSKLIHNEYKEKEEEGEKEEGSNYDVEDCGYVIDFEDTLIDYTSDDVFLGANKRIPLNHITLSNESPDNVVIEDVNSTLFYPSKILEKEHRIIIDKLRKMYVRERDIERLFQFWQEPKCGMGLTIKTSIGKNILVNNRVGNKAFNVFNSHFLGMEIHRDFDLLMAMVSFLKYNCMWGGGHISLKNCDYVGVFIGRDSFVDDVLDEQERRTSSRPYTFLVERATLISDYLSSRARIADAVATARLINSSQHLDDNKNNDNENVPPKKKIKLLSSSFSSAFAFTEKQIQSSRLKSNEFSTRCNHDVKIPLDGVLPLEESSEVVCLRCFLTLFFWDWDLSVTMTDYNKMICTVRHWMRTALSTSIDTKCESLQKLANYIRTQYGAVKKRGFNWPSEAIESGLFEYSTYVLSTLLEVDRWRLSSSSSSYENGDMEPGLLYYKLNTFGKTLLLLITNCTVHEYDRYFTTVLTETLDNMRNNMIPPKMETLLDRLPFNKINGRWFNVRHRGPSIWRYQIYAVKNIGNECPSLSLESRRMIPTSPEDNECCKRMLFKIHCRGSDLSKGGELVSDVCNSVSELQKLLNNKKYRLSFIDNGHHHHDDDSHHGCYRLQSNREERRWMKIESAVVIGEPIVSLEVTNYRPLKCSQYKNGSLIANRLAMLLNIRSGSRIKIVRKSKLLSVILLEDLSSSESASAAACERVLMGSKVLYYDMETTGLNPLADNAMITSIGCTLSRGNGNVKERSIFAYGRNKSELKEKIIKLYEEDTDNESLLPMPNIVVAETESELLCNFTEYVNDYCGPLTAIAGWNSSSFDDPFLFISLYKCLNNYRVPTTEKRKLFKGLFDFSLIMDNIGEKPSQQKVDSFLPMIADHTEGGSSFRYGNKFTPPLEKLISCLLVCPSLDMMKIMGKKFSEALPSMSLNTVLAHICSISNTNAVQKDPIDVKYHLLEYRDRTTEENALVQKYCCKDAYLVTKPAERMGVLAEIIQLGKESNMNVSVVSAMYLTQLHIIEGAVLRAMGPERAFMRSCAIRCHSQYTKTLGGYVTTPLTKFQTLHAMDMGSLYPSAMRQNNLDTTTVCSHRQIIDCRNRIMMQIMAKKKPSSSSFSSSFLWGTPEALAIMDEANAFIMDRYRPCDLVVDSWKNNRKLKPNCCVTRQVWENCKTVIEQQQQQRNHDSGDGNCAWNESNCHNCMNQVTDLGYFPEVGCNADLQLAALVNDDSHVELCSLEYMLPFLVPMMIDNPAIIAEVTARLTNSLEDVVNMLEEDFTLEKDQILVKTRYSYSGNVCRQEKSRGISVLAQSIESKFNEDLALLFKNKTQENMKEEEEFIGQAHRLMSICVRIARRVYAYDSAKDEAVAKWSSRLLNVGNRCRVWNARQWILQGTIPLLQRRYREERVVLKRQVKLKAKSEPLAAAQFKVEEGVKKLFMNSIYGVLVLRVSSQQSDSISRWKTDNSLSRLLVGHAAEGVGGGTRHAPMGNQITQISRRIFLNIGPSIRYFLPSCTQGYGDTDSVFMTHNFPREMQMVFTTPSSSSHHHPVIEMDLVLRERISRLLQIIVNSTTKGIRFNPDLAAGEEAMIIEHERLAITTHTAGKKTYHMIHFKEEEPLYINLLKTLVSLNETKNESEEIAFLEEFYRDNPVSRIVSLHKNEENADYVYPHNGPELCRLLTDDERAILLNRQSGGAIFSDGPLLPIDRHDNDEVKRSKLSKALSASKYFAAIKLEAVINALGNGFLEISGDDHKEAKFIDVRTGVKLSDPDKISDTSMALKLMKVYKKGKFTKKGISYASKLREIQTACLAWTQHQLFNYDTVVGGHAKRCLSYTEDPEDYITVSRVNKEQVPKKIGDIVTLPNPTARLINNHLNPSRVIELGEKFLTVLATSGRTLIHGRDATAKALLHLPKKRWNPITERGVLAVSSVKNLGVVCHTTHSIMELVKRDCDSIFKIISWCLDSLHNVVRGEGFCLADNASSYNTGILVSHILTKFLLSANGKYNFVLSSKYSNEIISYNNNYYNDNDYNNEDEDNDDNTLSTRDRNKNIMSGKLTNPLLLKINTIFSTLSKNQGQVGIPIFHHQNNINNETPEEAIDLLEKIHKCHSSVFTDLKNFTKIWVRAREYKLPRHESEKTPLSRIMNENAAAGPRRIRDILTSCASHVKKHSTNCRIKLVDDRDDIFLYNLISILGRENCLETCVSAGAAALLFNLLYCIFLQRRREKYQREFVRRKESFEDVCNDEERPWAIKFYQMMKKENVIRSCFSDRYHPTTNSLVFLAEPKLWLRDGSIKRYTIPNEMTGVSLENISIGIGTGSSLIRNNLVGPILDASNIHPFSLKKNMNINSSSRHDGNVFNKTDCDFGFYSTKKKNSDNDDENDDDDNDDDDEEKCIVYRPGFYHISIIEEMFACLGALIMTKNKTDCR